MISEDEAKDMLEELKEMNASHIPGQLSRERTATGARIGSTAKKPSLEEYDRR